MEAGLVSVFDWILWSEAELVSVFDWILWSEAGLVSCVLRGFQRVKSRALEDVVILNIDTNTLESPFEDLEKLPAEVVSVEL